LHTATWTGVVFFTAALAVLVLSPFSEQVEFDIGDAEHNLTFNDIACSVLGAMGVMALAWDVLSRFIEP
jgi:hypothetical protein